MNNMKKFMLGNRGVSEIVGTVLLLAIAVTTFSVFAIYVMSSTSPSTSSPNLNLVGYITEDGHVIIEHKGGESVKLGNIKITISKGVVDSMICQFNSQGELMQQHAVFNDSNSNARWDVGEYLDADVTAVFGNITHWQITAMVVDENSNSVIFTGILQQGITATVPPVAIFTYAPWDPKTQEIVEFNASQSYDPDGGQIVSYSWDFGDGNTGSGMVVVHKYSSSGVYNVTLTIIDDEGQSSTAVTGAGYNVPPLLNVTENLPPTADFEWNVDPTVDGKIDFTSDAIDPDGEIISYYWNFGDGSHSSSPNPSHIYDMSGNYTVTLVVTDDNGATYSVEKTITVPNKLPIPVLTYSPGVPNTKQYVFFDASSSFDVDGSIVNYSWDFENDGVVDAYGLNPVYIYNVSGNYTVNLTVVDNTGDSNYTTKVITVIDPVTTPSFIIVDNTPASPRDYDGASRIISAVQQLTSHYSTGKAIDSWYFVDGTESGERIEDAFLDEFDIVIWSTGSFPGDGGNANWDGKDNTWSTPMTEGSDDSSNHVYEIYQHLTHNGTLLLTGAYAVRDLQDYPGNGANNDEIWLGNTLGLVEPTGGIEESLHNGQTGYFATDYYHHSGTFSYGPIYAHGVIDGIPGTSSDGADIVITQDIPLYSLVKQSDALFEYSLGVTGGNISFSDDFEDGNLNGWTIYNENGDSRQWHVSRKYDYSNGLGVYHPSLNNQGFDYSGSDPYGSGYYAYVKGKNNGNMNDWLITPQITVPSGGILEFYAGSFWSGQQASFNVKLSTTTNSISAFNVLLGSEYNIPRIREHGWSHYVYDLSAYSGQQVYIAIQGIGGKMLFIDNFVVRSGGIPSGYYAIDAVRGANRSVVLGFDLNSPYITNESREAYLRNVVRWMAEGLGYVTEVYVDDDAPLSWYDETHLHTIQEGIDAVTLGGTIHVYNGTYSPTIVDKSVNIIGEGNPVINAANSPYGFNVTVDWVTIDGFVINGQNTQNGILLDGSSSNTITNCTISGCSRGISMMRSHHNTISHCDISSNSRGIYMYYSLGNTIENNNLTSGTYGLYGDRIFLSTIQNNLISGNSQDGVYFHSAENNTLWNNEILNNGGNGIHLVSSTNKNIVLENTISNNTNGVYMELSSGNMIASSQIVNNSNMGISIVDYSSQITVQSNVIYGNTYGISLENSSTNIITGNEIYGNTKGIKAYSSGNNNITYNELYENDEEAILLLSSSNTNYLGNNTIYNSTNAIYGSGIKGNTIAYNQIYSINGTSVYLFNSLSGGYGNNIITHNNISDALYGIRMESSSDNTISYNSIDNITYSAIILTSSSEEIIISYNSIEYSQYGVYATRSHYNSIYNNSIYHMTEHGILVKSYSSENDIFNNTVEDSKDGIHLEYSNINSIFDNTLINNNEKGINLAYSDLNEICNNTIYSNDDSGITLVYSDENIIRGNNIYQNDYGVILLYSGGSGNTISENDIHDNLNDGILLMNSKSATAGNNELISNEIYNNGGNGIYMKSSNINSLQGNTIHGNSFNGIFLNTSDSNTIQENIIYGNMLEGILLILSNSNSIVMNQISFNAGDGIYLLQSSEGDSFPIQYNLIWNNSGVGISINSSSSNHIVHNTIWNNSIGVFINISSTANRVYENNITTNTICGILVASPDCSGNQFYNNNFINNTLYLDRQAYDVGGNEWDNGYSAGGNYWSDYNGSDLTGPEGIPDGRGDTPYTIAPTEVGNVDQYPLMEPKKW